MLKNSRILFTLAMAALVLCMAADGFALQTKSRKSQGNNYGLELNLGNSIFTGTSEYPRGSGNSIPTYEGCWGHFLSVARDLDGDGLAEDTLFGRSRGRTLGGKRASLEAEDIVLAGVAAGHRMDQWMSRVENNEVWSSLDPDNLARWPAEFREGRTMSGAPILFGAETIGAMHSDAYNNSYHRSVPPTGASMEYMFYFLNFGESNDLAFGHLFLRNMSEYLKYNDNSEFVDQVASTPDGQVWGSFALMYVENYFGIGFSAASMDEGWAYHPARQIKCMVDQNGLEDGFTNGGMAFMIGYAPLKNMSFNGETAYMSNTTNFRWGADFGISKALDMGTLSDPGQVHRWATCLQPDGTERDISDFYGDEISPYTGRLLTGNPGVILPTDEYYDVWLWGRQARINYHAWSGLHDFGPRDTTSTDFVIMAAYPTNPPLVMKPNDIANLYDEEMQVQLAPFEKMQDIANLVYEGGYILPETPVPPPLTIVPGDRDVTITWGNVNLNTPDAYYGFIQENPEVDPNSVYREYDFEGFRLYRSFVGPSESHSELINDVSLSANNLTFHYIDKRDDDEPFKRMRNGMKVWYALVPYDSNVDPATGKAFSLPEPEQSKVWNRTFPSGYFTVRPRSDANEYRAAELASYVYDTPAGYSAAPSELSSVSLTGDGTTITQDPVYIPAMLNNVLFDAVNHERITAEETFSVQITNQMFPTGGRCGGRQLLFTGGGATHDPLYFAVRTRNRGAHMSPQSYAGGMSDAGIAWNVTFMPYLGRRQSAGEGRQMLLAVDGGGYAGATLALSGNHNLNNTDGGTARYTENGNMMLSVRNAAYEISWSSSGGSVTVSVTDRTHGTSIPFSPYIDEVSWGFVPPGVDANDYRSEIGFGWGKNRNQTGAGTKTAQSDRTTMLVETLPADNTEPCALWVGGQIIHLLDVTAMPSSETMVLRTVFGDWNGDNWTQGHDLPMPGDKWTFTIKPMSNNVEDIDLSKIKVVPNPYIASSMLDQSAGGRRLEFVNLPSRCTIRIYSLGGNLVNALNHIGAGRTGWGNFTDLDNIQPDNTPLEFTGYDNHSGTEPWNMKNRFGQTVASGLYFYHVTDERGETHIGKFYIVN